MKHEIHDDLFPSKVVSSKLSINYGLYLHKETCALHVKNYSSTLAIPVTHAARRGCGCDTSIFLSGSSRLFTYVLYIRHLRPTRLKMDSD
jgi:hypothetical protein